ncbi:hypothetical protein ACFL5V_02125 [Fibrobacterota bacterium]
MYHWHTHAGAEVDLLLNYDGVFYPVEVKSSSHPTKHDARGLRAFRETYPDLSVGPGFIASSVERAYQLTENDYVVPWNSSGEV